MAMDRPRRPKDPLAAAEAVFKPAPAKPAAAAPKSAGLPGVKQMVSLRLDEEVIEHFQSGGPGWQERINDLLRRAVAAETSAAETSSTEPSKV
jgi:uncharacterized protein (DUF4415 family)